MKELDALTIEFVRMMHLEYSESLEWQKKFCNNEEKAILQHTINLLRMISREKSPAVIMQIYLRLAATACHGYESIKTKTSL